MQSSPRSFARLSRVVFSVGVVLTAFAAHGHTTVHAEIVLATPSGVAPGGTFRFIAVTSVKTDAGGWNDFSNWDNFVNYDVGNNLGGATYNGQFVTGWAALVSVGSTGARDHIGGFGESTPFYKVDGTLVASTNTTASGGLWTSNHSSAIDRTVANGSIDSNVWTNTNHNGTSDGGSWDYYSNTAVGNSGYLGYGWAIDTINNVGSKNNYVYMVSPTLTAPVPEPSAYAMAFAGLACGGYSLLRRRRAR